MMKRTSVLESFLISLFCSGAPIDGQTQAEMNKEASADFARADAELNKTYEALLKQLPDAESKKKLKQSQRAWLALRGAGAAFAADEARGGSMAPTLHYATMTELTEQRTKQLKTTVTHQNPHMDLGTFL